MSYNLANLSKEERQAIEDEKARHFEFWKQNAAKAGMDAERIYREKEKRKTKWKSWADLEIQTLGAPEYQNLVRRAISRLEQA